MKTKTKIEKQKKETSYLQFVSPTLISEKMSLMDLFWGENGKFYDLWLNLAICQNFVSLTFLGTSQLVPFF